jgi:ribosomal protein RSM22 (predicted rRNA methylase)
VVDPAVPRSLEAELDGRQGSNCVHLPPHARELVEREASAMPLETLRRATALLSHEYRRGRHTRDIRLPAAQLAAAYLVTRLPATYAACHRALSELARSCAGFEPFSSLDAGAGPGAATLAAREVFPSLQHCYAWDREPALVNLGRQLVPEAEWRQASFQSSDAWGTGRYDLVLASYTLGELTPAAAMQAAQRAWDAARLALVIVEPGTSAAFALLRDLRSHLLAQGARMAAPCPAEGPCPMPPNDWCHFAARVERSKLHRRVKDASLSYEDEKFTYLALVRDAASVTTSLPRGRIVRRPAHAPKLIQLSVCEGQQIASLAVPHRDRPAYHQARKATWGDPWPASTAVASTDLPQARESD